MSKPVTFVPRPVAVEAMQVAKPYKAVADWAGATIIRGNGNSVAWLQVAPYDRALRAEPGDWIIRDADGALQVLTHEAFHTRYTPADRIAELERAVAEIRAEATMLTELEHDHFSLAAQSPAELGRELLACLPKD